MGDDGCWSDSGEEGYSCIEGRIEHVLPSLVCLPGMGRSWEAAVTPFSKHT